MTYADTLALERDFVFKTSTSLKDVIKLIKEHSSNAIMVIKSTIPVGYTKSIPEETGSKNIIFSSEF